MNPVDLSSDDTKILLAALALYREKKSRDRAATDVAQYFTHELKLRAQAALDAELREVDALMQRLTEEGIKRG